MVWFSFLHYTSLCISCDKNLEEFLMICFVLWASCCSFPSIKIYVCTWVDLLFVNKKWNKILFNKFLNWLPNFFIKIISCFAYFLPFDFSFYFPKIDAIMMVSGESTLHGGHFGHFGQNMLHLILDFIFGVWAWYFDFHKVNDI
jgi:hypothetical protein